MSGRDYMRIRMALAAMVLLTAVAAARAAPGATETFLKGLDGSRGVAVVLGDPTAATALDLARRSELVLLLQLPTAEQVLAARRAADAAGLLGTRIYVEQGPPARIALADDVADAVISLGDAAAPAKGEILRVLRPEGRALLGGAELTKPFPAGVDDWSHHYHGPDNNPQSQDRLARAPYLTQFVAEPRYGPAPQSAVTSAGRLFIAFGHVAWHEREEPWLNTLIAVNAFNGTMLWKRPLPPGFMVDRSTMVAAPDTLYLADSQSCKLLDPATGRVRDEIVAPKDLADGTFWKWMALDGGVLYALIGPDEPPDDVARWKSTNHGWPWGGISKGYNASEYQWGFGSTLLAIDPRTKKVLWHHREDEPIDSRSLALRGGRLYFCHFGKYLACVEAAAGKPVWRRTAEKDADLFEAIGPYRPGHGYVGGWKSTVYLKAADKALYFIGPQVNWLTAVSAEDGRFLWKYAQKDLHVVLRDDGLYTIGPEKNPEGCKKLDPLTGSVLASYAVSRRACTRSTGSADGIFFRASEGSVRLDLAAGKPQWIAPMRPQCHVGVVVGNGHLYWAPWACDCNLQMFGVISVGPAGEFKFDQPATEAERLETAADAATVAPLASSPDDWPAYRADNARSARTQAAVPDAVALLWQFAPPRPVEPTAPVAAGGLVMVAGADGLVRALNATTGRPRWTAYTGGAVRYPPAVADGRAFVGSGDGWAYALEAATGRLLWRFRASPLPRKIAVYGTLLDTWPVAAGVMVDRGTAYLAAGINNFDGTHVYALDAATGRLKWQNNTCGHLDAFSRRGVAVQGDLLLADGKLYLAGGDAVSPAIFNLDDGTCQNAPPNAPGSQAPRGRELTLASGTVTVSGQPFYSRPEAPVYDKPVKWETPVVTAKNGVVSCEERAGGPGGGWALVAREKAGGAERWSQPLPEAPVRWGLAVDAQGRITVTLRSGKVMCFGAK